jgi:hypothetical protein
MAHKTLLCFLGLALIWTAAAALAFDQPGEGFGGFQDRLLEIKRSQLGPALGVDQRTVDKLLQIDQRYNPLRAQLIREAKSEFRRLQQVISQPSPPEQEVMAILSNMRQKRKEMLDLQERKDREEMAVLTPVQQARYILYLHSLIKEARSIKGSPPGGMGPLGPGKGPREIPVYQPRP